MNNKSENKKCRVGRVAVKPDRIIESADRDASGSSSKKVWTLFKGQSKDALKDAEWIDMMQVVLGGADRNIIIEIREVE